MASRMILVALISFLSYTTLSETYVGTMIAFANVLLTISRSSFYYSINTIIAFHWLKFSSAFNLCSILSLVAITPISPRTCFLHKNPIFPYSPSLKFHFELWFNPLLQLWYHEDFAFPTRFQVLFFMWSLMRKPHICKITLQTWKLTFPWDWWKFSNLTTHKFMTTTHSNLEILWKPHIQT